MGEYRMVEKRHIGTLLTSVTLLLAACSPPLAATPTTAAAKPTTAAPAAASPGSEAAKPAASPAGSPAAAAGAAPAASSTSGTADAEIAKLKAQYYDAAKAEGKLVIYGVGNAELYSGVKAAFEQEFPGITIDGVDQRGRETREKILAEQKTRNFVVDVAISGPDTQATLIDEKVTDDFSSQFV